MAQRPDKTSDTAAENASGKAGDDPKAAEARNLAQEAVEEARHGDKDEAKFLAQEAKALDPKGATEVLKEAGLDKVKPSGGNA